MPRGRSSRLSIIGLTLLIFVFSLVVKAVLLYTWQEQSAEEQNEGKKYMYVSQKRKIFI